MMIDQQLIRTILEWIIVIAAVAYALYAIPLLIVVIYDRIKDDKKIMKRMKYSNVREAALSYLNNRIKAYVIMSEEIGAKPSLYIVFNKDQSDFRFQEVMHQESNDIPDPSIPTRKDGWFLLIQGGRKEFGYRTMWEEASKDTKLATKYKTLDGYVNESLKNDIDAFHREFAQELKENLSATKDYVNYY